MASPNRIDRNASSLNRLRRNMQRLTLGAAGSTIAVSATGGIVNGSTGLAIKVDPNGALSTGATGVGVRPDGSTITIVGDKLQANLNSTNLPSDIAYTDKANVFTLTQTMPELVVPYVTTSSTQIEFEQTGDTFGTIQFFLRNRVGANGGIVANLGLDLCDFGFLTNTNAQSNLRFEHRSFALLSSLNATNGEMQWVVNAPSALFGSIGIGDSAATFTQPVWVPHLLGSTVTPAIVTSTGAGTGSPTASVVGTDLAGQITISTGTAPTLSGNIFKLTFHTAYATSPYIVFSPANGNAAALNGATSVFAASTPTTFALTAGATALAASTQYIWNYHTIG